MVALMQSFIAIAHSYQKLYIKFIHTLNHAGSIKIKIADIHLGAFLLRNYYSGETIAQRYVRRGKVNKTTKAKSDIE